MQQDKHTKQTNAYEKLFARNVRAENEITYTHSLKEWKASSIWKEFNESMVKVVKTSTKMHLVAVFLWNRDAKGEKRRRFEKQNGGVCHIWWDHRWCGIWGSYLKYEHAVSDISNSIKKKTNKIKREKMRQQLEIGASCNNIIFINSHWYGLRLAILHKDS